MRRYLIFRNDRIGDFLISALLIKSIKRNEKKSHITIIVSKKNYEYVKSFSLVDDVVLFEKSIFNYIKIIKYLRSYCFDCIIVHDNKKRSFLISKFLKYRKIVNIKKNYSHIENINHILKKLNLKFNKKDLNILLNRNYKKICLPNKFICFHFDEKWFNKKYIKSYSNIEPSKRELTVFLGNLARIFKMKIVITTGIKTPKINNLFSSYKKNKNLILFDKINYFELEQIISKCKFLISCHGFVSHVAAAKNIPQIDIIDKSYNYKIWNSHFRNYKYVFRKKFSLLSANILNKI